MGGWLLGDLMSWPRAPAHQAVLCAYPLPRRRWWCWREWYPHSYLVGRMSSDSSEAAISPPMTTMASGYWVSEPSRG